MAPLLLTGIRIGLIALLWMPLIASTTTLFPYIVGKVLFAHTIIKIIFALWLILLLFDPSYRPRRSLILIAFAVYIAIAFLSAIQGVSFTRSLWSNYERMMGLVDLLHWFLLVLVGGSILKKAEEMRSLLNWNLGVALTLSLFAIAASFNIGLLPYIRPEEGRLSLSLNNPIYLGVILMIAILISSAFLTESFITEKEALFKGKPKKKGKTPFNWSLWLRRAFWGITGALSLWFLNETGSRGALFGLISGSLGVLFFYLLCGSRKALRPLFFQVSGILLTIAFLFVLTGLGKLGGYTATARWLYTITPIIAPPAQALASPQITPTPSPPGIVATIMEAPAVADRLYSTRVALGAWLKKPLLGWGPENFGAAFDQNLDPKFHRYSGGVYFDQAHNKLAESLTTTGIFGTIAYLGIWAAMLWTIIRRKRPPKDEVIAFGILGALIAYFGQNMFLFDTPATMLQFFVLMLWAVREEMQVMPHPEVETKKKPVRKPIKGKPVRRKAGFLSSIFSPQGRVALAGVVLLLLSLTIYGLNYRAYTASRSIFLSYVSDSPEASIHFAEKSFKEFPGLANLPRKIFFERLSTQWDKLKPETKEYALQVVYREGSIGMAVEPLDSRLLSSLIRLFQIIGVEPKSTDILIVRLQEIAPQRAETYQIIVTQEIIKGNYQKALEIADDYIAREPATEGFFTELRKIAQAKLKETAAED